MLNASRLIGKSTARLLIFGAAVLCIAACGQKGNLYLPTDPAAAQRATLVDTLTPGRPPASAVPTQPVTPTITPTPVNSAVPVQPDMVVEPSPPASAPR
jgi:predicted small lipoprotein YifL